MWTHVDTFSGIGGFSLAARWTQRIKTVQSGTPALPLLTPSPRLQQPLPLLPRHLLRRRGGINGLH